MTDQKDIQLLEKLGDMKSRFFEEIGKSVIGQHDVLNHILIALLCKGHTLIVGVPGLAKTLIIKSMSELLDLKFNRIQFTPDLMPSDITGTEVIDEVKSTGKRSFRFFKGPIFSNIILADEINRTPPKTQAALLEAMGAVTEEEDNIESLSDLKLSEENIQLLSNKGVKNKDDLAELSIDELKEIIEISDDEASKMIMKAREHWFK